MADGRHLNNPRAKTDGKKKRKQGKVMWNCALSVIRKVYAGTRPWKQTLSRWLRKALRVSPEERLSALQIVKFYKQRTKYSKNIF